MATSTESLHSDYEKDSQRVTNLNEIEALHIKYLGRNGKVNELFQNIGKLSPEDKKQFGRDVNALKKNIEQSIADLREKIQNKEEGEEKIDPTLPGSKYPKGSLHLVTYAIEEISRIFGRLGFIRMTYPEVEWEYFSFEALNMPSTHPARDDFETFFVDVPPGKDKKEGRMVLTPHTSSGQIREMLRIKTPPIRMINIAKTYRPNWDTTHTPMFHQFEGLCIDENISISDLKGTIDYFAKEFFGEDRKTRLRPYHFQFTEPSFEVDISCGVCNGSGFVDKEKCRVCKSGWLELGGAGMVHPNVMKSGEIDPEKYTGWAFGIGVERVMMMKEGIKLDDLRIMYSGDIRFLEQF